MTNGTNDTLIINTYRTARAEGDTRVCAAQRAWLAVRKQPGYRHLRAPYWNERIERNGSSCKSYRSPLGQVLGVGSLEYGSHSAKYPRTKRSKREGAEVEETVLAHLDAAIAG